jgi:membrane dipeptidase
MIQPGGNSPIHAVFLSALVLLAIGSLAVEARGDERAAVTVSERARDLHRRSLVFDGHNDLPWQIGQRPGRFTQVDIAVSQPTLHTDIPRLREGGVGAVYWSAYTPSDMPKDRPASRYVHEQIDVIQQMIERYPETFEAARTADDVVRIRKAGKIASLIGLEGGHAIDNSLAVLRELYGRGARYMTLTHSETNDLADSATDQPRHSGLSELGREVVKEMNRLGMIVDISHVSAQTMHDVLKVSTSPVIASHSSAFALASHPRNVPDDVLKLLKENRGVVMVNFYSGFIVQKNAAIGEKMFQVRRDLKARFSDPADFEKALDAWKKENPMERGSIHDVVDHIDHIVKVAGIDQVGLGSDFDGVPMLPVGLEDVSTFPRITQALLDRKYSDEDIQKILGENTLRVLREAGQKARQR